MTDPARPPTPGSPLALVVEDDVPLLEMAAQILVRAGYEVIRAETAEAAEEHAAASERPLDLLFTDVVLPGRTGIELAARLRERQPHLPVLVATGQWDPTVRRAVEAAGHQVLRKPYTSTQVVEAAARVRAVVDLTEPAAADGEHPPGGIAAR
ncbi:MAG: response regulator [Acidimicrobiales bacterium]|nr:response regulator [Actinomycetota bacterium]